MQGSRSACTGRALLAREALSSHERRSPCTRGGLSLKVCALRVWGALCSHARTHARRERASHASRARPMQGECTPCEQRAPHASRARISCKASAPLMQGQRAACKQSVPLMRAERAPCEQSAPHASRARPLHGERAPCKERAPLVQVERAACTQSAPLMLLAHEARSPCTRGALLARKAGSP